MKSNIKYISAVAILLLLSSCEKTIDIDIEKQNNIIVLNGLLKAAEYPSIQLYQSKFIFDRGEALPLRDAEVSIYENDIFLGALEHQNTGRYSNELILIKPSNEYTIKVTHSRLQDVEATVQIPTILSMENVMIEHNVIQVSENGYDRTSSDLKLTLKDAQEAGDYYLFSLITVAKEYYKDNEEDTVVYRNNEYSLETDDPTIDKFYINYYQYFGLRDNLFNGKNYTGVLSSYNDLSPVVRDDPYVYYENAYKLKISHVSEALYQYYIRLEDNRYPEAFTEPTQVYSNVENGYGVLGASAATDFEIKE